MLLFILFSLDRYQQVLGTLMGDFFFAGNPKYKPKAIFWPSN